jgi:hypothetical protein
MKHLREQSLEEIETKIPWREDFIGFKVEWMRSIWEDQEPFLVVISGGLA